VLGGLALQGVIGYVQYFNHLPAGLVWVHVSSSVVLWIFVLQLFLSTGTGVPRSAGPAAGGGQETSEQNDGVETSPAERTPGDSRAGQPPVKTTIS
jgi:cytochrome c oxidase assembly protein subunit 15